ncbi:MAG: hypothetical protein HYT75_01885 [Deltaproteobacteria bacterium]|nr:hypothetical protein [Deltaproteobacteria bacterium]MBI2342240.1 hypothetical protein [Deltaproteobacteria bacterium]
MVRPAGFIDEIAQKVGDNKTVHFELKEGQFFDGGEVTVSVHKLSAYEAEKLGLDPETQRKRLYCEGKYFKDGGEFHFSILDYGAGKWEIKQLEANIDSDTWSISSGAYAGLVSSEDLYRSLANIFS